MKTATTVKPKSIPGAPGATAEEVRAAVIQSLDRVQITQNPKTGVVTTKVLKEGKYQPAANYRPTKDYQMVDFPKVAKAFIEKVEQHMEIDWLATDKNGKWIDPVNLRKATVQELKLFGKEFEMDGQIHRKQAIIVSSSDGTKTFSYMAGLFRKICSNGAVTKISGESFRQRHLKSNEAVKKIADLEFGDLETALNGLATRISNLSGEISLQRIRSLYFDKKKEKNSGATSCLAILAKIYNSKTDKLDAQKYKNKYITISEKGSVKIDPAILTAKEIKTKVPKKTVFQAVTEFYRAVNSVDKETQTTKLLEALEAVN